MGLELAALFIVTFSKALWKFLRSKILSSYILSAFLGLLYLESLVDPDLASYFKLCAPQ